MSFLQPWLLAALPLVAVPIVIHLINQRRFQTIPWAAMMFLMAAQRMARGYSRLRQWLILAVRMLAVAGLVVAVARPLASGWLGLVASGKPDTTIILLDRSPSMQAQAAGSGETKLETARQQLVRILETFGSNRWVLIDSVTQEPRELDSPAALVDLPAAGPASSPADLPLMLQAAYDYIRDQRAGRTEIWICSDLRANDWGADSGRWNALRDAFLELPQGVRFQLLAYPQPAAGNIAVRVTDVRRQTTSQGAELLLSARLTRTGSRDEKVELPLQLEIEGARSAVTVQMTGAEVDLRDHRIPIEATRERGWGRVSIPADSNQADNDFYFVFDRPLPRRSIIVAEDPQVELPLRLAAGISPDDSVESSAEVLPVDQLSSLVWDDVALVLWQGALPTSSAAEMLTAFVERGGQVVFFPPRAPSGTEFLGTRWGGWSEGEAVAVENWRGDADLLSRTESGAALPVGQLEVHRHCTLSGTFTPLATLRGGDPLLARVATDRGGVYFWSTTPATSDSSLAVGGVVLYASIQRALDSGAAVLGKTRQADAGEVNLGETDDWRQLTDAGEALSTEAGHHSGVYAAGDQLLAMNRWRAEDDSAVLDDAHVAELFRGLPFTRIDDQAGNTTSLIHEIWRMFLAALLIALLMEAVLCLPKATHTTAAQSAAAQSARSAP